MLLSTYEEAVFVSNNQLMTFIDHKIGQRNVNSTTDLTRIIRVHKTIIINITKLVAADFTQNDINFLIYYYVYTG